MSTFYPLPDHGQLGRLLIERATACADRTAVSFPEHSLPYQGLLERSLQYALKLQEKGVRRGSRIALATRHPVTSYCSMIAIALLGATWLKESRALVRPGLRITHILMDVESGVLGTDRRAVKITAEWNTLRENAAEVLAAMPGNASSEDLAVIAESSGTTGSSKFIPTTYESRWRRVTWGSFGFDEYDPLVSVHLFPVTAASSSSQDIRVFAAGGTVVHGGGYRSWAERGVNQVSGSPGHLLEIVFREPPPEPGEPRIRRAWLRGSKSSREFIDRTLTYFDEVVIGYGATEVGGSMSQIITPENIDETLEKLFVIPGTRVEIVDDNDGPVPPETPGTVRVQTPMQATAYLDSPEASAKAFRNGWFYPGDLGFQSADGAITLIGRANDQFNIAGLKVSADLVDAAAQSVEGVEDAMSFVVGGDYGVNVLCVLIVAAVGSDEAVLADHVVAACKTRLDPFRAPKRVYAAAAVPKNENGKAVRGEGTKAVGEYRRLI